MGIFLEAYSRDIPAMESFSTYIGSSFTRNEKLETQTGNDSEISTIMESLNFHLFEIVQQALLWINLSLNPLGLISISAIQ